MSFSKELIYHVVGEIVLIGTITFYLNKKIVKIQDHLVNLNKTIQEQEKRMRQLEENMVNMQRVIMQPRQIVPPPIPTPAPAPIQIPISNPTPVQNPIPTSKPEPEKFFREPATPTSTPVSGQTRFTNLESLTENNESFGVGNTESDRVSISSRNDVNELDKELENEFREFEQEQ